MQVSLSSEPAGKVPAGITPTHIKPTGESAVALFKSQLLTAYPSMAELSKAGNDTLALASEAANRPSALAREMVSPPSLGVAASDRSMASSSDNIRRGLLPLSSEESNLLIVSLDRICW